MLYQRTLRVPVDAIGIGVHSGRKTRMRLAPAPAGTGVHFLRTDLAGRPSIPALAAYVCDTQSSTSIGAGEVCITAVEHVLSALHGLGIDNLRIELSGEDVPSLDGSAAPFVDLIQGAGIVEQSMPRQFIQVKKKISVRHGERRASLRPYAGSKATYALVSDHPVLDGYPMTAEVDLGSHAYQVRSRSGDEFVEHKLLDAIGDLYLLGKPLLGAFEGHQSCHALNVELVRALLARQDAWHLVTAAPDRTDKAKEADEELQPALMLAALEA